MISSAEFAKLKGVHEVTLRRWRVGAIQRDDGVFIDAKGNKFTYITPRCVAYIIDNKESK